MKRPHLAAGLLVALASSAVAAGCGSSSPPEAPNPARFVPADAALYVGAVLRPEGSLEQSASGLAHHLTGEADPYARLVRALETPGSQPLDYRSDIAPWLGGRGGMFLTAAGRTGGLLLADLVRGLLGAQAGPAGPYPFSASGAQGAILLDAKETVAARKFISRQASAAGAQPVPYKGVTVEQTPQGVAFALFDSTVVIGSTSGVHEVIDTSKGGAALPSNAQYSTLSDHAPEGSLASAYRSGTSTGEALPRELAELLDMLVGRPSAALNVVPTSNSLSLYADATGSTEDLVTGAHHASAAFDALPGESWFALGLGSGPPAVTAALDHLSAVVGLISGQGGHGGLGVGSLLESLTKPLVLLARAPGAAAWEGPVGIFATGSSPLEVRAGLAIDSTSAAHSAAAVALIGSELRATGAHVERKAVAGTETALSLHLKGLPVEVVLASGRGAEGTNKVVIGLGAESVQLALEPPSTMAHAASARDAQRSLGGLSPTMVLEAPTLLAMLETVQATSEPTVAAIVPYLKRLSTVVAGAGQVGGDISRYRVLATLHG